MDAIKEVSAEALTFTKRPATLVGRTELASNGWRLLLRLLERFYQPTHTCETELRR